MRNFLVLAGFFLISLLLFFPGHQGMLVYDANGWFNAYEKMGWHGLLYSFNDKSLHYLYHLAFFLCFKFFGFYTRYWAAFYCLLHAVAATTAFILFRKIYRALALPFSGIISFCGSLLFLLNAYNAEPVLWAACIHYPLCAIFTLAALIFAVDYGLYGGKKRVWLFVICYLCALFLLELSLALPISCIPLLFLFRKNNFSGPRFFSLQAVSVFMIVVYIIINKIKFGSVVGHYGSAIHLNANLPLISSNVLKYLSKYFLFSQFWPYEFTAKLYHLFERPFAAYGLVILFALLLLLFIRFRNYISIRFRAQFLLLITSVLSLAPVINLFFTYIVHNECDRLGYLYAVFFSHFIVLFSFSLLPYSLVVFVLYLGLNVHFLKKNVWAWKTSGEVVSHLIDTYKFETAPVVYILNLPDNCNGAYMFRSFRPESELKEALKVRGRSTGRIVDILYYNLNSTNDSVKVEVLSDHELKVEFAQWGNWWWAGGIGADNYSNDEFSIDIEKNWRHFYVLNFKKKTAGAVYIYQCGDSWRQVKGF
jgi:hypothetical protein